jgi:hypothetical protein
MIESVFSLFLFFGGGAQAMECTKDDTAAKRTVERINERYDDFFRARKSREEREKRREAAKINVRERRLARQHKLELARREFVKNRHPKPDDSHRQAWFDAQLKERERKMEARRRCYVQNKNEAEQILKRGRAIPGLLEYDLEDY